MNTDDTDMAVQCDARSGVRAGWFAVGAMVLCTATAGIAVSAADTGKDNRDGYRAAIEYQRSELESPEGLEAVHVRVLAAARRACRTQRRPTARGRLEMRECRERAVADALEVIDSRRLNGFHARWRDAGGRIMGARG